MTICLWSRLQRVRAHLPSAPLATLRAWVRGLCLLAQAQSLAPAFLVAQTQLDAM